MADNNALILVGMRGENGARAIQIDVSEIVTPFPAASVTLLLQRPTEEIPYPSTSFSVSEKTLTWLPTEIDTAIAGMMSLQIVGTVGDVTVKTLTRTGVILPALGPSSTDYPEPIKTWMDELQEMLTYAAKLKTVSASATDLTPGSSATVSLTQTASSTAFAFGIPMASLPEFAVDEDGVLVATYPDGDIEVGPITAYAQAVAGGYTGSLEDFETDMGNSAANAAAAAAAAASVSPSTQDDVDYIIG
jgi:hypothetical protein